MFRFVRSYILVAALAAVSATAQAIVIDWDAATWTNGATTGSVNGVDISITASTTGMYQPSLVTGNPPTPAVTRAFDGGMATGERTLELALNLPTSSAFVTVTLTFNAATYAQGATGISFRLFDIDYANASGNTYQDRVFNISGTTVGGGTVSPTISNLGSSVSNTAGVLTGTGSAVDTGAGSGNGNAQIDFSGSAIRSITFSYGSTNAFANPTYQHVGIHDITFTPVPEINPALSAALSCCAAGGLMVFHRARVKSRRQ